MKPKQAFSAFLLVVALALAGCGTPPLDTPPPTVAEPTAQADASPTTAESTVAPTAPPEGTPAGSEAIAYINPVLGLRMMVPQGLRVIEPEVLFPDHYGVSVVDPDGRLFLQVDWFRTAPDQDPGQAAQRLIDQYPGANIRVERTTVLSDYPTALVFPVPGQTENSYLFTVANNRLYQIIYGRGQLDEEGIAILDTLVFEPPTQSLDGLGLPTAEPGTPGEEPAPTQTVLPTETVAAEPATPTTLPDATEAATPAVTIPTGWVEHDLSPVGVRLAAPAEWTVGRQPGLYLLGTGTSSAEQWLYVSFRNDVPQDIPSLTEQVTQIWEEQGATGFTVAPITVGGYEGIAFEGLPNACREIYVPAEGLVHTLTVTPLACQDASSFNPVTNLVLDSITFVPATS